MEEEERGGGGRKGDFDEEVVEIEMMTTSRPVSPVIEKNSLNVQFGGKTRNEGHER